MAENIFGVFCPFESLKQKVFDGKCVCFYTFRTLQPWGEYCQLRSGKGLAATFNVA